MAKKKSEKRAIETLDKAVKNAMKSGVSGGLVDQTVASAIHAATVKAARKAAVPTLDRGKATKPLSAKTAAKIQQEILD
ncbi:hypothetical protein [Tunturiibacter gelidoferens]|uniref:Uncharacterized protein n=1 Tax=Tunturiibacter gelidiferens TaxID=3069689 RepID=A0ACC5NTL5_9BACT|nr:hypothetical protein [Edaphobacter lichenicola]MBB5337859.1 hypothetical protein [Edaphobacter lichenicola]